jgi:hypothetical protein
MPAANGDNFPFHLPTPNVDLKRPHHRTATLVQGRPRHHVRSTQALMKRTGLSGPT